MLVTAGHFRSTAHCDQRHRHDTLAALSATIVPIPEDDIPACECGFLLPDWVWETKIGGEIFYLDPICPVCWERKATAQLPKGV